jgi:thiamine-phosphate pyrophosphorylase
MDLEFTPALQFAWNRAARLARGDDRTDIEPLDLLRGLLAETEGHAAHRLGEAGFTLAIWQSRFPDDHRLPSDGLLEVVAPAAALRLVMTRASQETSELTDAGSLSTDQVLAALVALSGTVREALEVCGLDVAAFRPAAEQPPLTLDEPLDLSEPRDIAGAARIVDAAANRVREAIRVLEDHCRFTLDDSLLSRQCKELRHDLAEALAELPSDLLLACRDTEHDVGTTIGTDTEASRGSLAAVVVANAKRLQEGLRSLEEYGKVLSPTFGEHVEQLRYRAYTLEKLLVQGGSSRQRLDDVRLYALVTESMCKASLLGTIRELADGGVDMIQLREKQLDDRMLLAKAREVRELTRRLGVIFILNDRPDIARLAEADGVHLGQDDLPIAETRKIMGPHAVIGVSTHSVDQARAAIADGATYLGVGPTFPSTTKIFANFSGLKYVQDIAELTTHPAFAIGGVTPENVERVLEAGATRIAVSHALCAADDPRRAAELFRKKLAAQTKRNSDVMKAP